MDDAETTTPEHPALDLVELVRSMVAHEAKVRRVIRDPATAAGLEAMTVVARTEWRVWVRYSKAEPWELSPFTCVTGDNGNGNGWTEEKVAAFVKARNADSTAAKTGWSWKHDSRTVVTLATEWRDE